MDLEKMFGLTKQNFNLLVIVLLLVILGIVAFNAYAVLYVKAKDRIDVGLGIGAEAGLDIPFIRRK